VAAMLGNFWRLLDVGAAASWTNRATVSRSASDMLRRIDMSVRSSKACLITPTPTERRPRYCCPADCCRRRNRVRTPPVQRSCRSKIAKFGRFPPVGGRPGGRPGLPTDSFTASFRSSLTGGALVIFEPTVSPFQPQQTHRVRVRPLCPIKSTRVSFTAVC
jgi:hypothetical protein